MVATIAVVGIAATLLNVAGPTGVAPHARVRPQTALAAAVLDGALGRSPTVQRLVNDLEHSDVFVFIDVTLDPALPTAKTTFLTSNASGRFVHVLMNAQVGEFARIELLAHELQHVTEIARTPAVHDQSSFLAMLRDIGWRVRASEFETDAARSVELTVHRELTATHTRR
jgi:hypothetical protein